MLILTGLTLCMRIPQPGLGRWSGHAHGKEELGPHPILPRISLENPAGSSRCLFNPHFCEPASDPPAAPSEVTKRECSDKGTVTFSAPPPQVPSTQQVQGKQSLSKTRFLGDNRAQAPALTRDVGSVQLYRQLCSTPAQSVLQLPQGPFLAALATRTALHRGLA